MISSQPPSPVDSSDPKLVPSAPGRDGIGKVFEYCTEECGQTVGPLSSDTDETVLFSSRGIG